MNKEQLFAENSLGVHLVMRAEYTLCGDALEGDPKNGIELTRETNKQKVTCRACAEIIRYVRPVRIGILEPEGNDGK